MQQELETDSLETVTMVTSAISFSLVTLKIKKTWFYFLLHLVDHKPSLLLLWIIRPLEFHSTSSDWSSLFLDTSTQLRTTALSYGEVLDNLSVPNKAQTESDEA